MSDLRSAAVTIDVLSQLGEECLLQPEGYLHLLHNALHLARAQAEHIKPRVPPIAGPVQVTMTTVVWVRVIRWCVGVSAPVPGRR
ncbi:MAG: hypothetical protein Q7J48_06605, partial [Nocardioides sp.]|nr:hypothetical protein [Nocardioides sp.]